MSSTAKHTPGPWKTYWSDSPAMLVPGWIVKQDDDVQFPICIVAETSGGKKDKDGHSPTQAANAKLIAAAPAMVVVLQTIALHAPSLDVVGIHELCDEALKRAGIQ